MLLSYIFWDPDRAMFPFLIPLLNRPILWYGFLFALGFFTGYWLIIYMLRRYFRCFPPFRGEERRRASAVVDRLTVYMLVGTLLGARLGDLLFYQNWAETLRHPLSLFTLWEPGLASHGAAIGILIALALFARRIRSTYPMLNFLRLLDLVVVPTALAGVFIRIGNFFNQEILGKPTTVPWGVLFGHPADGGPLLPRHPAQLYEAAWLLVVWIFLFLFWKKHTDLKKKGQIAGLFLILVFTFRFVIEFFKVEQSALLSPASHLTMGQYLSLPFIAFGVGLFFRKK